MKFTRASNKVNKAIDAMVDLQQDYTQECIKTGITYEVQIILDKLNEIRGQLDNQS